MAESRRGFFGLADEKLYYDEQRKRFVSTKNAPAYMERQMKNNHFKEVPSFTVSNLLCDSNVPTCLARSSVNSASSSSTDRR